MTNKEKADVFIREFNLHNPSADIMLAVLMNVTGLTASECLEKIREIADGNQV